MSYDVRYSENKCIIVLSAQKMKLCCLIRESLFTLYWPEGATHLNSEHTPMFGSELPNLETPRGPSEGPSGVKSN